MYAIVRTGGKQYRVEEGSILRVEKLPAKEGEEVLLEDVLLISGDDGVIIPDREEPGAKVTAKVMRHLKGPKIIVFKYKPKKGYHRKQGHRQLLTELRIESIHLRGEEKRPPAPQPDRGEPEKDLAGGADPAVEAESRDEG